MCTDILRFSISFNYTCEQQTVVIVAIPDTSKNHQYFEITSLMLKASFLYYKNVKYFVGSISLQLGYSVILCILLYALKKIILRRGL